MLCPSRFALRANHVSGQRGNFFLHFDAPKSNLSRLEHIYFFWKYSWARNAREQSEQDANAKSKARGCEATEYWCEWETQSPRERTTENASAKRKDRVNLKRGCFASTKNKSLFSTSESEHLLIPTLSIRNLKCRKGFRKRTENVNAAKQLLEIGYWTRLLT